MQRFPGKGCGIEYHRVVTFKPFVSNCFRSCARRLRVGSQGNRHPISNIFSALPCPADQVAGPSAPCNTAFTIGQVLCKWTVVNACSCLKTERPALSAHTESPCFKGQSTRHGAVLGHADAMLGGRNLSRQKALKKCLGHASNWTIRISVDRHPIDMIGFQKPCT